MTNIYIDWLDLMVGDYNSDGMDDLFCHSGNGNTTVAESTVRGLYTY